MPSRVTAGSASADGSTAGESLDAQPAIVPISTLGLAGSPRSSGVDADHVARLVEVGVSLPPILVHRETMQIIDGYHRVAAAMQQGRDSIRVRFVDGPAESIFVMAVQANATHGLPLSLADRRSAAVRILHTHGHWSNRAIADITGLSAKTVGNIRSKTCDAHHSDARLGKDGKLRPTDVGRGRARAAELIKTRPQASLREIAAAAGISANTVRDVRARLGNTDNQAPTRLHGPRRSRPAVSSGTVSDPTSTDVRPLLEVLSRNPALRMNSEGRNLLRWIHLRAVGPETISVFHPAPAHCVDQLIEFAKRCSVNWAKVASDLEQMRQTRTAI